MHTKTWVVVGLTAAITLVACPTGDPHLLVFGGEAARPHSIQFGSVDVGETAVKELLLLNHGHGRVQLQSLLLVAGDGLALSNIAEAPTALGPGESFDLEVAFRPVRNGPADGLLVIDSDDPSSPVTEVLIDGEGRAAELQVLTEAVDFGQPTVGCVLVADVEIANVGWTPATVSAAELVFPTPTSEFTLLPPLDPTLAPGSQASWGVVFAPVDGVQDEGVLRLLTDVAGQGVLEVPLRGVGSAGQPRTELFEVSDLRAIDVLWVFDGVLLDGMPPERLEMGAGFFVSAMDQGAFDYRLGVLSMDADADGALLGFPPWITPAVDDAATAIVNNASLAPYASRAGFQSVVAATSPPTSMQAPNAGFLRDGVPFHVLFWASGDDVSNGPDAGSTAAFVDYLETLRPASQVTISSLTGGLTGCSGAGGSAGAAPRFVEATVATNGRSGSICDPNIGSWFFAAPWWGPLEHRLFRLADPPLPGSIEVLVSVDGGAFQVSEVWDWVAAENALRFDEADLPPIGSEIRVDYATADCPAPL